VTPVLYDEHDGVDQRRVLESQDDPLIMYLVAPRRPDAPAGEVLEHAALSAVRCVQTFAAAPAWSTALAEWERSAFRKVCLGARPAQLGRARALSHASAGEVLCFPPRRRSAAEPELARLQAHTGGPLQADEAVALNGTGPVMVLLVAQDLELTVGKACAQVAHAALIERQLHRPSAVNSWEGAGCPIAVALANDNAFRRAKSELVVAAVRDAGLTQIPAGTETVLATEPGTALPDWLRAAARTIV